MRKVQWKECRFCKALLQLAALSTTGCDDGTMLMLMIPVNYAVDEVKISFDRHNEHTLLWLPGLLCIFSHRIYFHPFARDAVASGKVEQKSEKTLPPV